MTTVDGEFTPGAGTRLVAGPGTEQVAEVVRADLAEAAGVPLRVGDVAPDDAISLRIDPALPTEGYRLRVDSTGIDVAGGDAAGVFYGAQTVRQLLSPGAAVHGIEIEDRPAFGWRGSMLDVARHFMPKEFILRYVDLLAMHKLNVLHLHLTDDQGWRVEIRRYPRLTEVGAWRPKTLVGHAHSGEPRYDDTPHGGFYTQDDMREIVAYAARRFVRVMPEIDLPGHMTAAIAAYPELGNVGPVDVACGWGIEDHCLNVEESTVDFFKNVFEELFELFPSPFLHVGGDECKKDEWRASSRAQELMRERNLADEDELQSWYIRQFDEFLAERGRRLVGWDEILEGGLAEGATVMSWRGEEGGISAAQSGHDVVMAPTSHTYFDYYQAEDHDGEPLAIGGFIPLSKVYEYRPIPAALDADAARHVLGAQFQLWTEYMPTPRDVEYMAFPRACAFAEAVWSADREGFDAFRHRLDTHLRRLDALGVAYRRPERSGGG